jgi:hypothetical protein
MSRINDTRARAVADLREKFILASVEVAVSPERVFRALASNEITEWWVRPGVFDTREWTGDVRAGGRWRASGMTRGEPDFVSELCHMHPETPVTHRVLRGHVDAYHCCGKSLMGPALLAFDMRQRP